MSGQSGCNSDCVASFDSVEALNDGSPGDGDANVQLSDSSGKFVSWFTRQIYCNALMFPSVFLIVFHK